MDKQNFVRKIMIDSRFRKSGTPGDFTYELGRAITLPTNCAGMVLDVEMIHSWYNVDDHNCFFYFYETYFFQSSYSDNSFFLAMRAPILAGDLERTSVASRFPARTGTLVN